MSGVFWVGVLVNTVLDNCKVMFLLTDILQSLHIILYLDVWLHPVL